ncbi:SdpI family protein [Kytococcus sedentarius]|uniref:SdpI family protein n=1 Tax=Kytococcus sedentarius TaxID=1276 RepID=UPI00387A3862
MNPETLVAGASLTFGLLLIAAVVHFIGQAAAGGELRRNRAVGIRTRATMASDEAWTTGHSAARGMLRIAAIVALVFAAATATVTFTSAPSWVVPLVGVTGLVVAGLVTVRGAVVASRAAHEVTDSRG